MALSSARPRLVLGFVATILGSGPWVAPEAAAQPHYAAGSQAWNGLGDLTEVAAENGVVLETPQELDLADLGPRDAILVVYPTEPLPTSSLARFMRAGGRVGIADDYGESTEVLRTYGIRRNRPSGNNASRLRDNPNLPVAEPHAQLRHPLTQGVKALVTNHPTVLAHSELEALYSFEGEGAVVLVGAVGEGRLVAIGDPSLLINNMLQFRGNRRFAANLLTYLTADRGGRVWLVSGDTPIVGHFGDPAEPLARVQDWLASFASADLPPLALMLSSLLLVALFVLITTSSLPRRTPYEGMAMLPAPSETGGFVGRVAFFRDRPDRLLHPLLVYKSELEGELVRRLGLRGRPRLRDVISELRRRGLPEADLAALRELLSDLDRLHEVQDRPPGPPKISERRFRRMVETGERILDELGEAKRK
ncbi:MAG: DUF4350 domain-containing protein [Myxococcota bacterium]